MTVNLTEITQLSLQLAQWCFLECEVGPWKAFLGGCCWVFQWEGDDYSSGKRHSCTDEPLLCKTGTVPGLGLVLNVAAVSLLDYKSNYLIIKHIIQGGLKGIFHHLISNKT